MTFTRTCDVYSTESVKSFMIRLGNDLVSLCFL